jgi:hypothetical protein
MELLAMRDVNIQGGFPLGGGNDEKGRWRVRRGIKEGESVQVGRCERKKSVKGLKGAKGVKRERKDGKPGYPLSRQ